MPTFLTDIVSPSARKWLYAIYALVSTALAATAVGFATANAEQPTWLLVSGAVWLFLGGAFGLTAGANVHHNGVIEYTHVDPPA